MFRRENQILFLVIAALGIGSTGCDLRPNWGAPGPTGVQRTRAVLHDPFPKNDLGPPLAGARPPGFEQPMAETTSLQSSPYAQNGSQHTPTYGF